MTNTNAKHILTESSHSKGAQLTILWAIEWQHILSFLTFVMVW